MLEKTPMPLRGYHMCHGQKMVCIMDIYIYTIYPSNGLVTIPNLAQHITAIQYHPVALPGSASHTLFFGGTPSPAPAARMERHQAPPSQ